MQQSQEAMYAYHKVEIPAKAWDDCKVGGEEVVERDCHGCLVGFIETSVATHCTIKFLLF